MVKNIIFDWSGVINDNTITIYKVVVKMFNELGVKEISFEEFRREWEQPYMVFYNKYLPDLTLEEEQELYKRNYKKIISENPPKTYPGLVNILKDFKGKGINMIVISSDLKETILEEINLFGLEDVFSEVNFNIHNKSQVIKEAIGRNRFNIEETIFIGDTTHEIESGKRAGILTGAVTWGFQKEDKLKSAKPDFIIHNLKELEGVVL